MVSEERGVRREGCQKKMASEEDGIRRRWCQKKMVTEEDGDRREGCQPWERGVAHSTRVNGYVDLRLGIMGGGALVHLKQLK